MKSCVLGQPCSSAKETQLIECDLLDRKPKSVCTAFLDENSLGAGDVRTLAMPIIKQVCKVSSAKGANEGL